MTFTPERLREQVSDTLGEAADAAVHGGGDAPSRAVELLGRVGLVAYGLVHVLLAGLTLRLALGTRRLEVDQQGAVHDRWWGTAPLLVIAAGLAAFGAYCFVDARYRRAGAGTPEGTGRITRSRARAGRGARGAAT